MSSEIFLCSFSCIQVHILTLMGEKKIVARYPKFNSRAISSSSWLLVSLHHFPSEPDIIKVPPTCCVTDLWSRAASQGSLDHVYWQKENWANYFQNLVTQKHSVAEHSPQGGGVQKTGCHFPQALWGSVTVNFLRLETRGIWAAGMDFTFTELSRKPFFCMVKNNKLEKCSQITFC